MDCYREAESELARRRARVRRITDEKIEQLKARCPEYAQIEQDIKAVGLSLVKCRLYGINAENVDSNEAELRNKLELLRGRKRDLLAGEGLPEDFGEKISYCPICHDEGYIVSHGRKQRCSCFQNIYIELLTSEQTDLDTSCRFEDFSLDFYPEQPDKKRYGIGVSPREYMKRILGMCIYFTDKIPDPEQKNLIFTGKTGLGKTFLCSCMANALLARGISVLYIKASEMFNQITFNRNEELRKQLYQVQALIIDDLGIEKQTDMRYSDFLELLDKRDILHHKYGYATVISTNLDPNGLLSYYDERICSRLFGNFDLLRFAGEDIRLMNK